MSRGKNTNTKVCVKKTTMINEDSEDNDTDVNIGKGLFALCNIAKGSIIAEYKGKLLKPEDPGTSSRSNIYFNDEYILECPESDIASYANDPILFTRKNRKLMEALHSDQPFYQIHPKARINAEIKINDNLHRAFLMAATDIIEGEEIFCHYGFMYWFRNEITKVGFLEEEEIERNGFPEKIFEYPGFISYVKEFYPDYLRHEVRPFRDMYDFIVHLKNGHFVVMPIENFASQISKKYAHELNI